MKTGVFKLLFFALFFGTLSGVMLAVLISIFLPEVYTDWAGRLVCPGRIEYMTLKRTYFCYTSANDYYNLGDAMFWAVFKRFVFPAITLCFLLVIGLIKLGEFLYARRAAAGF